MRTIHWLFVVSVLFFVSGIGFVIAGARQARRAPAAAAAAPATVAVVPLASVKQIMKGIVGPSTQAVFDAVTTEVTKEGIKETAPQTDAEWETLGNHAAALAESGNMMLVGNRVVDQGDWVKYSRALIEAAKVGMKATETKNVQGILDAGEELNATCDGCHGKYQRGS